MHCFGYLLGTEEEQTASPTAYHTECINLSSQLPIPKVKLSYWDLISSSTLL